MQKSKTYEGFLQMKLDRRVYEMGEAKKNNKTVINKQREILLDTNFLQMIASIPLKKV